jgi:hypothetical protein
VLGDRGPHRLDVPGVDGLHLDQEFVADRARPGRLGGEVPQRLPAGVGEREHPLVGPAFLLDHPGGDQPVGLHPLQLLVQLLRRGRPEVRHRRVEPLAQVVARGLALQQGGHHRIAQRHRHTLPLCMIRKIHD